MRDSFDATTAPLARRLTQQALGSAQVGDSATAVQRFQQAIPLDHTGHAAMAFGRFLSDRECWRLALDQFQQAYHQAVRQNDADLARQAAGRASDACHTLRRSASAAIWQQRALRNLPADADPQTLLNSAIDLSRRGEVAAAERMFAGVLALHPSQDVAAAAWEGRAAMAARLRSPGVAMEYLWKAFRRFRRSGDHRACGRVLSELARHYIRQDRTRAAHSCLNAACARFRQAGAWRSQLKCRSRLLAIKLGLPSTDSIAPTHADCRWN